MAGLVALLSGPWLRVTDITWTGEHYTRQRDLERLIGPLFGANLLAVDTAALRQQLGRLPPVASVAVAATLPGRVEVTIQEREATFVWETASARLLGAADGTLFAALGRDQALAPEQAGLPRITDQRAMGRLMTTGDRIDEPMLRTALRLADLDPAMLGSEAPSVAVRIDDEYGFRLVAAGPAWEVALGTYGTDPAETSAGAQARLERQIAAVRTLFAGRPETEVGWIDVRNPGKVYFRAKG